MSQYDFGIIDPYVKTGVDLATMLNLWRDATYSLQRGPTRPAFIVPGQMWVNDAGGATNWIVNVYVSSGIGDKPLWKLNTTTGKIIIATGIDFEAAPKWPTPLGTSNDTTGATTAFVKSQIGGGSSAPVQYQSVVSNAAQGVINAPSSSPMLITEGVQVASITFTPKFANSKITVQCLAPFCNGPNVKMSLFAGNTNMTTVEGINCAVPISLMYSWSLGSVTPVVIQTRIAGSFTLTYTSTLEITEYSA